MKIGDKIYYKGEPALIADKWSPHLQNPALFKSGEVGYKITTETDCKSHICCREDEKYMALR